MIYAKADVDALRDASLDVEGGVRCPVNASNPNSTAPSLA